MAYFWLGKWTKNDRKGGQILFSTEKICPLLVLLVITPKLLQPPNDETGKNASPV